MAGTGVTFRPIDARRSRAGSFSARIPGLTANDAIRFGIETVALRVDQGDVIEFGEKAVVVRDAFPVRVDHDDQDAAILRRSDEVDDVRLNWRFAAGELNDRDIPRSEPSRMASTSSSVRLKPAAPRQSTVDSSYCSRC
jgi:hypothetical protein